MITNVDLTSWSHLIRLPYYVLYAFRADQGRFYDRQLQMFVSSLHEKARQDRSSIIGQIADDSLGEYQEIAREMAGLARRQVVFEAKAGLSIARATLHPSAFSELTDHMATMHQQLTWSQPLLVKAINRLKGPRHNEITAQVIALIRDRS